ncbi:elongation factor P [Candidatus Parcubacteria bacterium]|nr:elongation factor P [Candidatus Parcubacteria bacterium]
MLSINEIKLNKTIKINNEPYSVVSAQHLKIGRGGAILKTKLKNLISGNVLDHTFKGADKAEEADLARSKADFLYQEGDEYFFMDQVSFEQFSFDKNLLGAKTDFLKDGLEVDVLNFEDSPVAIDLPKKVELKVVEAPPGIKGDTAQGGTKQVVLETGATINVPLFINADDIVRVNTETGKYVERV